MKHAVLILVVLLAGCPPERPDVQRGAPPVKPGEGQVVAEIAGESITLTDFQRRIDRLPSWGRARLGTVEARQHHLKALADFELLADEAERRNLVLDPRVKARVKRTIAEEQLDEEVRRVSRGDSEEQDDSEARAKVLASLRKDAKIEIDEAAVAAASSSEKK